MHTAILSIMLLVTCGQANSPSGSSAGCYPQSYALYQRGIESDQWQRVPMNMGQFHLTATVDSCSIAPNGELHLVGDVHHPYPSQGRSQTPAPQVELWQAEQVDGMLRRTMLLGVTDTDGKFAIQAHGLKYVMVMESDTSAITYTLP